jgi:hydroxymethylbilane synthase
MPRLRIGTRGSQLALWQARTVAAGLERAGARCELVVIKTSGDRLQQAPLSEVGGKRLFVKEIEDALLRGDVDLAVHSAKDMPAILPEGLAIGAVLPREDPRDAIVLPVAAGGGPASESVASGFSRKSGASRDPSGVASGFSRKLGLGPSPRLGTGSVRRIAQLRRLIGDAAFHPIRGNLDTRLRKLDDGDFDALVLACAGLTRLGFGARISTAVEIADCTPAPGQGIVAIETRTDDEATRRAVQAVNDPAAADALEAERALVAALGGGCQLPLGAVALDADADLHLHAVVISLEGARLVRRDARGPRTAAAALGRRVAEALMEGGASAILDEVRSSEAPVEGNP